MGFSLNLATIVGAIFGIILLFASALAIAKANFAKAQLEGLRQDIADYEKRETRHEKEIKELQRDRDDARTALKALEKVVTGRDLLEALNLTLSNHHTAAMTGMQTIHHTLEELVNAFEETRPSRPEGRPT